ncbi:MAG TPA: TerC family protein [Burkholderiales bacterium]|jgi:YjbE family integral membrane protein|nr:TerC family protein [Burkholderiales bacterium]
MEVTTAIAFGTPEFWAGLMKIIGINIVLSGDNAVVIALASRSLPPHQQKKAIWWGSGAAIIMRIVLTFFAVALLSLPWLKLVGAALLLWIGVQLLLPEEEEEGGEGAGSLAAAIKTILIADLVMSLDNVIAVAAAAKGSVLLLILGLAISIPLVIFGSTMLLKVMERFPIIITIGGGLLGFVAGEMAVSDPAILGWVESTFTMVDGHAVVGGIKLEYLAGAIGAAVVVAIGKALAKRKTAGHAVEDLATKGEQPGGGN